MAARLENRLGGQESAQPESPFAVFGQNQGYVEELYRLFLTDPGLVGDTWIKVFAEMGLAETSLSEQMHSRSTQGVNGHAASMQSQAMQSQAVRSQAMRSEIVRSADEGTVRERIGERDLDSLLALQERATRLVFAYRERGHLGARVNPLTQGVQPLPTWPNLNPQFLGIEDRDLSAEVQCAGFGGRHSMPLGDLIASLRQTYCGSVGFELGHVFEAEERTWLQTRVEQEFVARGWFTKDDKKTFFRRLHEAEAMESELHRRYVGSKRFSLQGGDTLLPMLEVLLHDAGESGLEHVVIGMAHRGRLNVLANITDKPLHQIFVEFEDSSMASVIGAGDVKYHLGTSTPLRTRAGKDLTVTLAPNPSHLEIVNPVVNGITRAIQDESLARERKKAVSLLIHGDAAFIGQGVVSEALNFANTQAYTVGGTVHLVINNQVGFTTDAAEARSSTYCTDVAKICSAPILHVNSEDIEACCWAMRLALDYRNTFGKDVVLDLYCYRKYGHNEGDDPTFTQPLMYEEVKRKRPLAEMYGDALIAEGTISADERRAIEEEYSSEFKAAAEALKFSANVGEACSLYGKLQILPASTAVAAKTLTEVAQSLVAFPQEFTPHPKLKAILEKRVQSFTEDKGIDWGMGETLAFGSILLEGTPIRMSGQDVGRGTFSHRHLEIHDYQSPERFYPLRALAERHGIGATFELYNSTLSEEAVMGFEFGYAATHSRALVLWEAQFGDFANGAQVIIDQFLAASEVKWGQRSGLMLLLPHGYEGQGPEHSSARLERFLQLCAEGNMSVISPTTPAQYFHLLRRQAKSETRRPVVVMSPKSLLRSPDATSQVAELTEGRFQPVLVEEIGDGKGTGKPLFLMSGKVFYDVRAALVKAGRSATLARVEQLHPFPERELKELLSRKFSKVAWVQEEPQNMGAWSFVAPRLLALSNSSPVYIGRPESASTACGSSKWHSIELARILEQVTALSM